MKPVLITRPQPDAQATRERLAALDIDAVVAPVMTRQTLSVHLPPTQGFAAIAVTSTNALRALEDQKLLASVVHLPLYAVGDRTAHEARSMGFAEVVAAGGTLDSLVTTIGLARLEGPLLYPVGRHVSGDLARALAPQAIMTVTVQVYEMVAETTLEPKAAELLTKDGIGAVMLYSQRTADLFCALALPHIDMKQRRALPMLCLSENVARPALQHHFTRVLLADYPSEEAMMSLALAFSREQTGQ